MSVVIDNNYQLKETFYYIYHNNFTIKTEVEGTQTFREKLWRSEEEILFHRHNLSFSILIIEKCMSQFALLLRK